jgi:benzoyl-CoA reductase/2-hydroxyglutaryl-CoA dehydratase subunit BcrC/BadD/HgdB
MKNFDALEHGLTESGKPVMGCFPLYPPMELFHAMGFNPVVLWGLKPYLPSSVQSDKHVQAFACSIGRHVVEFLLAGKAALIDNVFFYNACDTLRNLPEILSTSMACDKPRSHFYQYHVPMHNLGVPANRRYFSAEIERLVSILEADHHVSFSNRNFQESVEIYRKMRESCRLLQERVASGQLRFGRYAQAVHAGNFMPVERAIEHFDVLLKESTVKQRHDGGHRIMISGILPPPPAISDAIEGAGLVIAANDIASMQRSIQHTPRFDAGGNAGAYYVDFYLHHCPCSTLLFTADQRVEYLVAMARRAGVEGLLFIGEKFCEHEYLEFPYIEKTFKQNGIPVLSLEVSIDDQDNIAPFKNRIDAFAEMLGSKGSE